MRHSAILVLLAASLLALTGCAAGSGCDICGCDIIDPCACSPSRCCEPPDPCDPCAGRDDVMPTKPQVSTVSK